MLHDAPLGKISTYIATYSPELLFPIPRSFARDKIGLQDSSLPFHGVDIWNGFELSWLNPKGKPEIALAEFYFPCQSPNIVESKSFKLYLNSFNLSSFESHEAVKKVLEKDLSQAVKEAIHINLYSPKTLSVNAKILGEFSGICLDNLDISTNIYEVDVGLLKTLPVHSEEAVYSDLLKSNCLATGQPDWGSLYIRYAGNKIDHEGLLKYIISFRNHSGFAEHCVEQIFHDISARCQPKKLTVYARYTRRGGLDINPFRSNFESFDPTTGNIRHFRQ